MIYTRQYAKNKLIYILTQAKKVCEIYLYKISQEYHLKFI